MRSLLWDIPNPVRQCFISSSTWRPAGHLSRLTSACRLATLATKVDQVEHSLVYDHGEKVLYWYRLDRDASDQSQILACAQYIATKRRRVVRNLPIAIQENTSATLASSESPRVQEATSPEGRRDEYLPRYMQTPTRTDGSVPKYFIVALSFSTYVQSPLKDLLTPLIRAHSLRQLLQLDVPLLRDGGRCVLGS